MVNVVFLKGINLPWTRIPTVAFLIVRNSVLLIYTPFRYPKLGPPLPRGVDKEGFLKTGCLKINFIFQQSLFLA